MNFDGIIYLPQVLREEIVYWANNYSVVIGTKKDLKDNSEKRYIVFSKNNTKFNNDDFVINLYT